MIATQYIKDSQIPQFPKELEEKYFNEVSEGVLVTKIITPLKRKEVPQAPNLVKSHNEISFTSQLKQALAQTLINTISVIPRFQGAAPIPPPRPRYATLESMPKPQNYRTVPCRLFHSTVGCSRGDFCHFIHDERFSGREIPQMELQKKQRSMAPAIRSPMMRPVYFPPQFRMPYLSGTGYYQLPPS